MEFLIVSATLHQLEPRAQCGRVVVEQAGIEQFHPGVDGKFPARGASRFATLFCGWQDSSPCLAGNSWYRDLRMGGKIEQSGDLCS